MNLQQMKYVIYTAEYHSISKAARKLFVTQPNLSGAIRDLENELRIKIFERGKSGVSLTKDGLKLISQIRPIVEQVQGLEDYYRTETGNTSTFSVAAQHGSFTVDAVIQLLKESRMDVYKIQLLEVKTKEVLDYMQEGRCDIGILLRNRNNKVMEWEIEQRKLDFHLLRTFKPHVYIQKGHPLADYKKIAQNDLKPYPYTRFFQGADHTRFFTEELVQNHVSDKIITITDKQTNINLQKQMNAYTIGSGITSEKSSLDSLIAIPYDSNEVIELGWLESRERKRSSMMERFIHIIQNYNWT